MHLPIVGSIDSFIMAAAMAVAGCPERYQRRVILGFFTLDMLAAATGSVLRLAVPGSAAIAALALAAVVLLAARRWPALYLALPLLLCVDNLVLGTVEAPLSPLSIAADGVWSALLACAGFELAKLSRERQGAVLNRERA